MKNKTLPICLQVNYRESLEEFSKTSYGMFGLRALIHFKTKIFHLFEQLR